MNINSGFNFSVLIKLSSHQTQYGFKLNTFVLLDHFQFNTESIFSYYPRNIGQRKRMFENKNSIGIVGLFGNSKTTSDFSYSCIQHQSFKKYGIAYSYIWYRDNQSTSQKSGAIGIHFNRLSILHENDFFSGFGKDRFRTGDIKLCFQDSLIKYMSGIQLWTGETSGTRVKENKDSKTIKRYKDLSDLPYGRSSNGIFFIGISSNFYLNNNLNIKAGWDSEQIRHLIQNKILHDFPLLPNSNKTPYYPRLDSKGLPTFKKENMKKPRFFYSFDLNGI